MGRQLMKYLSPLLGVIAVLTIAGSSASAQALEPSAALYNQLQTQWSAAWSPLNAADRMLSARSAGLPAQPGELENIETQLLDLQDQATALEQGSHADGIDPHVQRAAEAQAQAIHEFLVGMQLANLGIDDYAIQHVKRFSALTTVRENELAAYATAYHAPQASAAP